MYINIYIHTYICMFVQQQRFWNWVNQLAKQLWMICCPFSIAIPLSSDSWRILDIYKI